MMAAARVLHERSKAGVGHSFASNADRSTSKGFYCEKTCQKPFLGQAYTQHLCRLCVVACGKLWRAKSQWNPPTTNPAVFVQGTRKICNIGRTAVRSRASARHAGLFPHDVWSCDQFTAQTTPPPQPYQQSAHATATTNNNCDQTRLATDTKYDL